MAPYISPRSFLTFNSYHNAQRNIRFAPVAKRIKERMTPLLFTLSAYLSRIKVLVLESTWQHDSAVDCNAQIDVVTTAMLRGVPACDLKTLHYMWLFLLWLLNTLISRPTYAGTIERTFRGWTADPLDRSSLARILVFGNLPAIKKMLNCRDYVERRKWAQGFLKSLEPEQSIKWAEHWQALDVGLDLLPSENQAKQAVKVDLHMQSLWTQGAQAVFEELGEESALLEDEKKPSANNTVRLLADLAGYDLFHASIPPDYEEDDQGGSSIRGSSLDQTQIGSLSR
ncbi:hypothetical protein ANO11243_012220 [Dothideomycetidae sp. 11243]|nr:hypothetical protein ANO11243_012220 [fungal sp. No.11243]